MFEISVQMTKSKVILEFSLVLVPANAFLVPENIFLQKKHWSYIYIEIPC